MSRSAKWRNRDTNLGWQCAQGLALIRTHTTFSPCLLAQDCVCWDLESSSTCLALVYLGVLWHRQLAGHRGWASTLYKVLTNTLANGVFPTRISLRSIFCQSMPKSTMKTKLVPGKDSSMGPGQFEPAKVHRL